MPQRFSASVAAMHMACHASANLDLAIPGWQKPVEDRSADNAANRGTAKHAMLEPIFELGAKDIGYMAKVLQYVADLRSTRRFKVLVEHEFTATWLPSQPSTKPDLVLYTADEIHVLDQKWGKIEVPVFDNHQLLFYAACAAKLAPKAKGVTAHIMQPYCDKYESWFIDTNRLAQFMAEAVAADTAIQQGSTVFGPSDNCTFCPANPHSRSAEKGSPLCPAMLQILYPSRVDEDAILGLA